MQTFNDVCRIKIVNRWSQHVMYRLLFSLFLFFFFLFCTFLFLSFALYDTQLSKMAEAVKTVDKGHIGITWQFKKQLDDAKFFEKPYSLFNVSFGTKMIDAVLQNLDSMESLAQVSLTFEEKKAKKIVNITANVNQQCGKSYAKSILKVLQHQGQDLTPNNRAIMMFNQLMKTFAGQRHTVNVVEPFIMQDLDLSEINHNPSPGEEKLFHHGPIIEVNTQYSCSSFAKDPPGFYSIHSHVKGSPNLFVFLAPSYDGLIAEEMVETLLTLVQGESTCKNREHWTFLTEPETNRYKAILLKEGESIGIFPGTYYQKISLGNNLVIKQLMLWDKAEFENINQGPVDCTCEDTSLRSCGLPFTPKIVDDVLKNGSQSGYLIVCGREGSKKKFDDGTVGDKDDLTDIEQQEDVIDIFQPQHSSEENGENRENEPPVSTNDSALVGLFVQYVEVADDETPRLDRKKRKNLDQISRTVLDTIQRQSEQDQLNEESCQADQSSGQFIITAEELKLTEGSP